MLSSHNRFKLLLYLSIGLSIFLVFVFSITWFSQPELAGAQSFKPAQSAKPAKRLSKKLTMAQKIEIIRTKLTPSTANGPVWTPNDFPRYEDIDDALVPFHESAADLKMYPLEEWLPTQQTGATPDYQTASFFLRPPDWVPTYGGPMNTSMIDLRGPVVKDVMGQKSNGVWATITIYVTPRRLLDANWTQEIMPQGEWEKTMMGETGNFLFPDGTEGVWARRIPNETPDSIGPSMRERIYHLTENGFVVEAELRVAQPLASGKLERSGELYQHGQIAASAAEYYEKVLKQVVETIKPQRMMPPRPIFMTLKNCQLDPFWSHFHYGDKVRIKNLDKKRHILYGYIGADDMVPPFQIFVPAGGETEYFVDIPPNLWATIGCDRKSGHHMPLMVPGPLAAFIDVQPEPLIPGTTIIVKNCRPFPWQLRVEDGGLVTFRNEDNVPHTLVGFGPDPFHHSTQWDYQDHLATLPRPPVVPPPNGRFEIKLPAKGSVTKPVYIYGGGAAFAPSFMCDGSKQITFTVAKPEYQQPEYSY